MGCLIFPFFFPFRSRPLIGGAGIAGKIRQFPFRDISGIAGKNKPFFSGAKGVNALRESRKPTGQAAYANALLNGFASKLALTNC